MSEKINIPPARRPKRPFFSSGPCSKYPGWTTKSLDRALVGRSHRSGSSKDRIKEVLDRSREILKIPDEYFLGIVPASDTGAVEIALWSLLGERGVDVLAWESFGTGWVKDIQQELQIRDLRIIKAEYGELPNLNQVDWSRDVVFTWNGTTSGVCVPDGDWIKNTREGLSICDATSAAFAMVLPWEKLDVVTFSWQKVLGGEAQHGVLIVSPKAVRRLETYVPPWPLPKIFRLTSGGKLLTKIFQGETINTPSMLCVEDVLGALKWADKIGGGETLILRSGNNLKAISDWVDSTPWVDFLATSKSFRSSTSVCLKIVDPWFLSLGESLQAKIPKEIDSMLEEQGVAFDINGYRDAPPGLRIWAGSTIETEDLKDLFPWLDWAFSSVKVKTERQK